MLTGRPIDVPAAVKDLQPYVDEDKASPALEFLSPVKGSALEQITAEVGSVAVAGSVDRPQKSVDTLA